MDLIFSNSCIPSIRSIFRSVSTRSNSSLSMIFRAFSPFSAIAVRYPSFFKTCGGFSRAIPSSSTIKIRMEFIVLPFTVGIREKREMDGKSGSLAFLAFHADGAVVFLDDTIDDGEAQTGSDSDFFGGEKGIENPAQIIFRNSLSIILEMNDRPFQIQVTISGDGDSSGRVLNCLESILQEV